MVASLMIGCVSIIAAIVGINALNTTPAHVIHAGVHPAEGVAPARTAASIHAGLTAPGASAQGAAASVVVPSGHAAAALPPLPVLPLPSAPRDVAPDGQSEDAFNKRVRPALDALPAWERTAIVQFTHADGVGVRLVQAEGALDMLERGFSADKIHALAAEGDAVEDAILRLAPDPGTVYRGLSDMGLEDAARLVRARELQLGPNGRGALAVATWDAHTALERYLGSDPPTNDPNPALYKALLVIKAKSGVAIAPLTGFHAEREMLFGKDAHFRVVTVGQAGSAGSGVDRVLVFQLEELDSPRR